MKHAGAQCLAELTPLLERLRCIAALVERRPGIFYFHSKAFLHFHEDPAGTFADVRFDTPEFERLPVSTVAQRQRLLDRVTDAVQRSSTSEPRRRIKPTRS